MAWNGSGVFARLYNWATDKTNGIKIRADRMDGEFDNFKTGLENCQTLDGQNTPTANLPMGNFKHTGVGNASARNHYLAAGQAQDDSVNWCGSAGGTADVITLSPSPAITAYAAGQRFGFIASGANTGAVTVNISGLGAKAITKNGTTALAAGNIPSGAVVMIQYDGTQFQLITVKVLGADIASPEFSDSGFRVVGSSDATKKAAIEVDGNTAGQTRTGTWLDYNFRFMSQTKGGDVASASTIDLDAATGDLVDVTGTTPITAITLSEGRTATVRFTAALTLTNGASLVLPGATNRTTVAGDVAMFRGYASGVVRCVNYMPVSLPTLTIEQGTAKAWVSWDVSSGTPTIKDSFNVSSLTDNAAGDVTVNFAAALPNANYAWASGVEYIATSTVIVQSAVTVMAGSIRLATVRQTTGGTGDLQDRPVNAVAIFGDY
jgi:hypothetical protein